ncbi:hypothetical protein RSPPQCQH_CDS0043 [Mycolicibacterium phage phi1_186001]
MAMWWVWGVAVVDGVRRAPRIRNPVVIAL